MSAYQWLKDTAQAGLELVAPSAAGPEVATEGNAAALEAASPAVEPEPTPTLDALEGGGEGPPFDDGGGYTWRADGDDAYTCVGAPAGQERAIGHVVTEERAPDAFALLAARDPARTASTEPAPEPDAGAVETAPTAEPAPAGGSAFDLVPGWDDLAGAAQDASNRLWETADWARDAASNKAGEVLEAGVERVLGLPESHQEAAPAPEPPPAPIAVFEVTDDDARLREPGTWKTQRESLPQGTLVQVLRVDGRYAEVAPVEGDTSAVWTAASNLSTKPTFWQPPRDEAEEVEQPPPDNEITPEGSTWTEWMEARKQAAARDAIELARWLTGADQEEAEEAPDEAQEQDTAERAPQGAVYETAYTIAALGAMPLGRDKQPIDGALMIQPGTSVWLLAVDGAFAHIQTLAGQATPIAGSDDVWLDTGFIGGFGTTPVSLANEHSMAENAENSAAAIEAQLPEGRSPGSSPFGWKFKPGFELALDGTPLQKTLLTKVQMLCEWAIANDMVTGDIHWASGMRSPAKAHRMCVAWNIQYGEAVSFDAVKALPGGKDMDGNVWYQDGWTWAQVQENAKGVRSSSAIAAAGWERGNARRAPLPIDSGPGVSSHCTGGAIDVTIPWRAHGKPAQDNATDVWGWESIYRMFGLERTLPKGHKHEECWHLQETSKILADDESELDL